MLVIPSPRVEAAYDLAPVLPLLADYDTQNLRWLAHHHPSLYRQLVALPWVEDGLSELERDTIDQLLYIGVSDIPSLRTTLGLPWVQDAISEVEYDAIDWLSNLGVRDIPNLAAVIAMPFLHTPDSTDVLALRSIHRLAREDALTPLMDHPLFLDGITDDETTLVAAVGTLYRDTDEISRMLDPGYASIEAVTSTAGLQLSIIRSGSQSQPWTADAVADAVDYAEQVMLLDLSVDHVILVLNDKAVPSTASGANHGFAISYLPEYEQMQDTFEGRAFQQGLVHEVAHYYWRGNENWIDEGLANTIEYMHGADNGLSPGQLKTRREDCEAHDLEMLSEWDAPIGSPEYYCSYYLGERLFLELRESLDDAEFSEKLRELYQLSLTAQEIDQTPGIATVRQVFIDQGGIVDKHWSGALNAPENRPFDEGLDRITHDLIQWDQHPTYDGQEVSFRGTLLDDAVLSWETLSQAREGGYSNFSLSLADDHGHLGFILPLLQSESWILDHPGDTVAVVYQLDERAFTVIFLFPPALGSPSDYAVIVGGFRNETRNPSIGENIDVLGYARIRADENTAPQFPDTETGARSVAENTASGELVGDPVAATDADNDVLTYTLGGDDSASFGIDLMTGQLMTLAALDYETKDTYSVTVTASDSGGLSDSIDVTITVTNVDEPGAVNLSSQAPVVGIALTASLTDDDDEITGMTWQWASFDAMDGTFTPIEGATSSIYTPVAGDVGKHLRATASYTDGEGSGKSERATSANMVTAADTRDPLLAEYDPNADGVIEKADMRRAVGLFFGPQPTLSRADMRRLVGIYFSAAPNPTPTPIPTATPTHSIRPGTYAVGQDIDPGTYVGIAGTGVLDTCYWARLQGVSGALDDILANDNAIGQFYIEVLEGDGYLETHCQITSLAAWPEPSELPESLQPGTYLVGRDIAAGTYRGEAGEEVGWCYWARLNGVSGELKDVAANHNATGGPFYVEVLDTDYALNTTCDLERVT